MKKILKSILPKSVYSYLKYKNARRKEPSRYKHLYKSIEETGAKNILEIGTWNGERALRMIYLAQRTPGKVSYYGFDLFEAMDQETYEKEISKRPPSLSELEDKLSQSGASIHLFKGNTLETLNKELHNLPKMDFIFIDGGHHINTIQNDWDHCKQLMHDGTIVIFDDYWHNRSDHGAKSIVDNIDKTKYEVTVLPEINTFETEDFGKLDISFAEISKK